MWRFGAYRIIISLFTSSQSFLGSLIRLGLRVKVPFCTFSVWAPFLKPNSRNKDTLVIGGYRGNLESQL